MDIAGGYLLFLGDIRSQLDAKTALGIAHWCPDRCIGQWRLAPGAVDAGLVDLDPASARALGARTMVIGIAARGGRLPAPWVQAAVEALEAGLDVASGLHDKLADNPRIAQAATANGRRLFDVRHASGVFPVATGARRSGCRLLTVGTDCAVGKKFAALAIHAELVRRGVPASFRATGQTGILIAGSGIAIDAVVADFAAGAAEALSPAAAEDHWDVIEGQGSLFHPAYAGVSLALLHGSQPDALVVVHDPTRTTIDGYPDFAMPSLQRCIERNVEAAQLTNPSVRCVGVAINGAALDEAGLQVHAKRVKEETGLPCTDVVRQGVGPLVDALLSW